MPKITVRPPCRYISTLKALPRTLATLLKSAPAPSSDNLLAMDTTSILRRRCVEESGERAPLAATQEGEVVRLVMQLLAPSLIPPARRRDDGVLTFMVQIRRAVFS